MKKILFLIILSTLLLLAGCGREKLPAKKTAVPMQAQNFNLTEEAQTTVSTSGNLRDNPLEGAPLEEDIPNTEPGDLPSPNPIEPTEESAEK